MKKYLCSRTWKAAKIKGYRAYIISTEGRPGRHENTNGRRTSASQ